MPNPADLVWFRRSLLTWWKRNKRDFPWRLGAASRYHQVVSEVLLQRTKAETVAAFWATFTARFPSWRSLAAASVNEIEVTLKPIGLSKQRAPRLKALATAIAARGGRFPVSRAEIEALPGVGQYITNAVLLFCFDTPHPLVDVNMARVLERVFGERQLADIRYDPYLQELAHKVVSERGAKELNWAIFDFAAKVCTARAPRCQTCPLSAHCIFWQKQKKKLWTQSKKHSKASHSLKKQSSNACRHTLKA